MCLMRAAASGTAAEQMRQESGLTGVRPGSAAGGETRWIGERGAFSGTIGRPYPSRGLSTDGSISGTGEGGEGQRHTAGGLGRQRGDGQTHSRGTGETEGQRRPAGALGLTQKSKGDMVIVITTKYLMVQMQ